jgi:hypothetical protein
MRKAVTVTYHRPLFNGYPMMIPARGSGHHGMPPVSRLPVRIAKFKLADCHGPSPTGLALSSEKIQVSTGEPRRSGPGRRESSGRGLTVYSVSPGQREQPQWVAVPGPGGPECPGQPGSEPGGPHLCPGRDSDSDHRRP